MYWELVREGGTGECGGWEGKVKKLEGHVGGSGKVWMTAELEDVFACK